MPEDGAERLNRPPPTLRPMPCSHTHSPSHSAAIPSPAASWGSLWPQSESSIPVSDTSVLAGGYGGSALPSRGAPGCLPAL